MINILINILSSIYVWLPIVAAYFVYYNFYKKKSVPTPKINKENLLNNFQQGFIDKKDVTNTQINKDYELMLAIIERKPEYLEYADKTLKNNHDFILQAFRFCESCHEHIGPDLSSDKDFIMKLIDIDANLAIKCASDTLKEDQAIAELALDKKPSTIEHFKTLCSNKIFVKSIFSKEHVRKIEDLENHIDLNIRKDTEFILSLFQEDAYNALRLASEELKKCASEEALMSENNFLKKAFKSCLDPVTLLDLINDKDTNSYIVTNGLHLQDHMNITS